MLTLPHNIERVRVRKGSRAMRYIGYDGSGKAWRLARVGHVMHGGFWRAVAVHENAYLDAPDLAAMSERLLARNVKIAPLQTIRFGQIVRVLKDGRLGMVLEYNVGATASVLVRLEGGALAWFMPIELEETR